MSFKRYHHITSTVTGAKADHDFHVGVLGLRNVKRTVLLDGERPFYHLYYGNELGEPGTLLTSFAFGPDTPEGRRGSGQVSSIALSVPNGTLGYWEDRLRSRGVKAEPFELLGSQRLRLWHPDGIEYQLVQVQADDRLPWTGGGVPPAAAIRGVHSVTVSTRETDELAYFLAEGMGLDRTEQDGSVRSYAIGDGCPGRILEIDHQPGLAQGSWGYMRNTIDHVAFDIGDSSAQLAFKAHLEAMGFIDVTEPRDRNYFYSVYFRTPAGAMFEATWTHPDGFLKDESADALGTVLQLPDWLQERSDTYVSQLEPLG